MVVVVVVVDVVVVVVVVSAIFDVQLNHKVTMAVFRYFRKGMLILMPKVSDKLALCAYVNIHCQLYVCFCVRVCALTASIVMYIYLIKYAHRM